MNTYEEKARAFALAAHRDQKYGTEPYIVHPAAVRQILADFGITNPYLVQGSWLHDTIEDTGVTHSELWFGFGKLVADLVWAVSGFGPNRKARNASTYEKIVAFPTPWAAALKLVDRIANAEACRRGLTADALKFGMYRGENPCFREMLGRTRLPRTRVGCAMLDRLEVALA